MEMIDGGDDVGLAREERDLAAEEVDDELLVGGEEVEARRKLGGSFSHGDIQKRSALTKKREI